MKIVRHAVIRLAVILAVTSATGCTFRPYLRDSRDPALAATPPCYSSDVCGSALDGESFEWTADLMQSARR